MYPKRCYGGGLRQVVDSWRQVPIAPAVRPRKIGQELPYVSCPLMQGGETGAEELPCKSWADNMER